MIWLVKFSSANWVNPLRKSLYSTNVEKCLHVMRVSTDVKLKKKKTRYVRSSSVLPFLAVPDPYGKVRKVYMPCASNDIKLKKKKDKLCSLQKCFAMSFSMQAVVQTISGVPS